jgi:transposase
VRAEDRLLRTIQAAGERGRNITRTLQGRDLNVLEGDFTVLLVNPAHIKQVPGRKTDVKDCRWVAELLEHGLLRGSFIPPVEIRDLRELTRYRRQLVHTHSAEGHRLQKVLEDANIKLASVATEVMGVSGQRQYNEIWLIGRHGYKTPVQVRHEQWCALADAASF